MAFHEQDYPARYRQMGDKAEAAYLELLPHGPAVRFGWERPPIAFGTMPDTLRYMPDFYTQAGFLVEVIGCGRDGIVKGLKVVKLVALHDWGLIAPVAVWVWNSHRRRGVTVPLRLLVGRAGQYPVKTFEHGRKGAKDYYEIPWADMERWHNEPVEGNSGSVGQTA